jgi:site-specific DNA recombinase
VLQLFEDPELITVEIRRRLKEIRDSKPTKHRKDILNKELIHVQKGIEKLLDAYQEGLIELDELRKRLIGLRKKAEALKSELNSIATANADQQIFLRLADNIDKFLARLRKTADTLSITDRQKILRLVVKEILVDQETIKIKHSIPVGLSKNDPNVSSGGSEIPSYLLRSRGDKPDASKSLSALCV